MIVIYPLRSRGDGTISVDEAVSGRAEAGACSRYWREAGMPATADRASVASYAQLPAELDRDWLGRMCHLSGADLAVIRRRTDPVTQLGYATQLVTVRAIGTFQPDPSAVPEPVVAAVA